MRILLAIVVLAVMACPLDAQAQLMRGRTRVVCGPNGCRIVNIDKSFPVRSETVFVVESTSLVRNPRPVTETSPSSINETTVAAARVGDRPFVNTVRKATVEARSRGEITLMQQARIMAAVRLLRVGPEVERLAAAELNVPSANGLIDWENFDPEKFMELVKVILLILSAFGIG